MDHDPDPARCWAASASPVQAGTISDRTGSTRRGLKMDGGSGSDVMVSRRGGGVE